MEFANKLKLETILLTSVHPANVPRAPAMCLYIFALSHHLEDFEEKDSYDAYFELLKDAKCFNDPWRVMRLLSLQVLKKMRIQHLLPVSDEIRSLYVQKKLPVGCKIPTFYEIMNP